MTTRAKLFSQLAKSVDTSGTITSDGISSTVSLGATVYDSIGELPTSGYTAGEQAFVKSTSRLYINSGVGWYNVAVINNTPTIQSILDSDSGTGPFVLSAEGAVTTITITAQDSDGDALTYTASADSDFNGLATISQVSNVFTITPFSQDSATTTSGTITFNVTDNINIANSVQTFTLNFVSALWDETVLSVGTNSTNGLDNSTFIDRSTNAHTVTPTGSPVQTAFHPYLDNWSLYNSDNNNGLYKDFGAKPAPLSFVTDTTSDGTIEAWIYLDQTPDVTSGHVGSTIVAIGDTYFAFLVTSSLKLRVYWWTGSQNNIDSTGSVSLHTWHHVAMVKDGNAIAFYIDGVAAGTGTITATSWASGANGNYLRIANNFGSSDTAAFKGYLSNLRLTDAIVYSGAFTPSTEALTAITDTTLLTCQSNRFIDNSTDAHAFTRNGSPEVSAYNPFGQGSEYAVGENKGSVFAPDESANHYMTASWNAMPSGTEDFTMQFWAYQVSNVTSFGYFGQRPTSGNNFQVYNGYPTAGVYLLLNDTALQVGTNRAVPLGEWVHYAFTRSGNTFYGFINGELIDTVSSSVSLTKSFTDMYIMWHGVNSSSAGDRSMQNAYMADLNIIRGTAVYTSAFTPPTAPVGNTNASLYLPMDNAGIFDKTGNNTLTLNGNSVTSTTKTKYATTSMRFAAANDYLITSGLEIGGFDDVTIEGWFNFDFTNSNVYIAGHDTTYAANNNMYQLGLSSGRVGWWIGGSLPSNQYDPSTLSTNTWYHLAWVKDGTSYKIYKDGTQVASFTNSAAIQSHEWRVGNTYDGASQGFTGYIENFQILNGVAKYTASFTPPTQTQGRQYQAED